MIRILHTIILINTKQVVPADASLIVKGMVKPEVTFSLCGFEL